MTISPATLSVLILALLLLAGLFVLLPLGLEALANRNKRTTTRLHRQVAQQQAALHQQQARLQPYTQLASGAYRQLAAEAKKHLTAVTATLGRLGSVKPILPTVPRLLWPATHFLRQPNTAVTICRDWWQLRQAKKALAAAHNQIQQAVDCLQQLETLPATLRREAAALAAAQETVASDILAEQTRHPANIGNLADQQRTLAAQTTDIQRLLAAEKLAPAEADTLANRLDAVKRQHQIIASTLADRQQRRQAGSDARRAAAARLAALQPTLRPYQQTPLITHLRQQTENALAAADQAAGAANWPQAEAALVGASRWLTLGEQLVPPLTAVDQLSAHHATSRQPEAIDHLQTTLEQQLHTLHTALPDTYASETAWQTALDACQDTLDSIVRQAKTRLTSEETDRQRQAAAARQARRQLDRAWSTYQRQLHPAADDLLRQRYSSLQNRFANAADAPRVWWELATDTSILTGDILTTTDYITMRSQHIAEMRQALPDWVDEAETVAGRWHCLQPNLNVVRETAAFLQQLPAQQRQIKRLADLHLLFDQAKQAWLSAQDALSTLRLHGERLNHRLESIEATHHLLTHSDTNPDSHTPRTAILQQVIARHLDDAFRAGQPEDAIHALAQAETYLQKLL